MGSYIPSTKQEQEDMLKSIGFCTFDDLFCDVPESIRYRALDLPDGLSEQEVFGKIRELAGKNRVFSSIFRGAGAYNHYIPAIVKSVTSKEEFVTAYTPYQAEISQGVLQSMFEYQTMVCELFDMDASNASIYDGASAAAEAITMCLTKKRGIVLLSESANPMVTETIKTYAAGSGAVVKMIPCPDGRTDAEALKNALSDEVACIYIESPNYFGLIEDAPVLSTLAHEAGALCVMGTNPIACGLYKTPGECGADIAVSEGQPLGMPLSFGGPYLGIMACREALTRKLPGRIVGQTTDADGKRAFVLTLQAREQHIRRERASSNVCSNQALCAMTAAVYLAAMGPSGLAQAAKLCYEKAHYAQARICEIPGFSRVHRGEFFHEFMTTSPVPVKVLLSALEAHDILGGLAVGDNILWCVTEQNSKKQIDALCAVLSEVAK